MLWLGMVGRERMAHVWRTRDRFGREVALTDAGWNHIVAERQGAPPTPDEIREAGESPDGVTADATFPRRENFYRSRQTGRGGRFLKVVVRFQPVPPDGTWAGEVITAHPARRIKPGEDQLWP